MVHVILFPFLNVLYCYVRTFRSMYAVPNMAVLFVDSWVRAFSVCCWGFFEWFWDSSSLLLLLPVSLFLLQYHVCCFSVVRSLYFRIFSAPFFITFLFIKLRHLLAYMFLLYCHRLWCQFIFWDGCICLHLFIIIIIIISSSSIILL